MWRVRVRAVILVKVIACLPFFGLSRVGGTANKKEKKEACGFLPSSPFSSEVVIVPLKQDRPESPETLGRGSCPERLKVLLQLARRPELSHVVRTCEGKVLEGTFSWYKSHPHFNSGGGCG